MLIHHHRVAIQFARARYISRSTGGSAVRSAAYNERRTLSALQHDPDRPEDVDSSGEDHCEDEIRYAVMVHPAPLRFYTVRSLFWG
jgi:hypothetical protein